MYHETDAYKEGQLDRRAGAEISDNPYSFRDGCWLTEWADGWMDEDENSDDDEDTGESQPATGDGPSPTILLAGNETAEAA